MIEPQIHRFETVSSTNDVALDMARSGEPEGTVVLARSQSAGRGRRGRIWLDEPEASVLLSVVLRPRVPQAQVPQLSFVASLCVGELLRNAFDLEAMLKWPNDVLVGGRKIAGLLVETTPTPHGIAAIVGIGLNTNQAAFHPDIATTATSICIETDTIQDVDAVAVSLSFALLAEYQQYLAGGFEEILNCWCKYMWGAGRQAEVSTEGNVLRGMIVGVDHSGALLLRDASGATRAIVAADSLAIQT